MIIEANLNMPLNIEITAMDHYYSNGKLYCIPISNLSETHLFSFIVRCIPILVSIDFQLEFHLSEERARKNKINLVWISYLFYLLYTKIDLLALLIQIRKSD